MTLGQRTGYLLINLGSPASTSVADVRRYLHEFLSDPLVLDIHPVARWLLLHGVILRRRPARSAAAYQKIWGEDGSPLLVHSEALRAAVAERLDGAPVALAMRYREPSIRGALEALRGAGVEQLVVLPLYPQFALASTRTSQLKVERELAAMGWQPELKSIESFYDHPGYIAAYVERIRPLLNPRPQRVLFSFHGLPERHCTATADPAHCLAKPDCCAAIEEANARCYRAQCFATARAVAARLDLAPSDYEVSFQSRLGRTPWIRPYTDHRLAAMPGEGVTEVVVASPSFVADCLETLEELALRERTAFLAAGGARLDVVPCLNSDPMWADAVVDLLSAAGK
jgi:ferrochelatase